MFYDCTEVPEEEDRPQVGRIKTYDFEEYVEKFEEIYGQISREAIYSGNFDERFVEPKEEREVKTFDDVFLEQLEEWREKLARNVIENNPEITQEELNYFVHRLLNRIIFLRICEDRNHEPYEKLKNIENVSYGKLYNIFKEADEKYNSRLFKLIEEYGSDNLSIDPSVLASVLEQLYYPDSPYTFAVVESHIIGKIYDLFLGRSYIIDDGELQVEKKPEVKYSQGKVTTPKFIVKNIVDETVGAKIKEKAPESLENFSVADICCGSGLFLNTAFEKILDYHREYFKENSPEEREEIYRVGNEWRLTLKARKRILEEHIFGVDVDKLAVEVARFSLLLKILEDQPKAAINQYMDKEGTPILPDLGDNVRKGNSLVDESFFEFVRSNPNENEIIQEVVPFSFNDNFSDIMENGGFDVIVSNPSYVRIQNMVKYLREEEMAFYNSKFGYVCAQNDNYDKYYLFIERGLDLLSEGGSLGYIVPQKFLTLKSGKNLRRLISEGRHLRKIVHFGVNQIFEKSSNYTCLLFLENSPTESFDVINVEDLEEWKRKGKEAVEVREGNIDELDENPWPLVGDKVNELFERINDKISYTLDDVADIFVGAQTSWNKGYIMREWEEREDYIIFEGPNDEKRKIEKELVRTYFYTTNKRKPSVHPISKIKANGRIIYPYKDDGDIIEPDDLKNKYPKAWEYFENYEERLRDRDLHESDEEAFYRYGRKQSIGKFSGEKIIVQVLSREARYGYDDSDIIVTGGGNGPFYNIRPYDDIQEKLDEENVKSELDIRYILAVISHPVMEAMVRSKSSFFRGGYYSHGKQFIKDIPIKLIDKENEEELSKYKEIISLVNDHIETHQNFRDSTTESRRQIYEQQLNVLEENIIEKVSELYQLSEPEVEVAETV